MNKVLIFVSMVVLTVGSCKTTQKQVEQRDTYTLILFY